MFDLTGRAALVTGAGRGVGFGIAAALLERGAQVWVNDLVTERAEVAAAQLGEGAHPVAFDVADEIAVDHAIRAVGQVDILVNNAGIPPTMRAVQFREMNRHEWNAYIDVNLYGILNCVKATVDGMCERGWGRVITISSGAGTHGQNIGVALYAAGKGAGISFMRHLAMECARKGVTANTLALGMMEREPSAQSDESSTVTAGLTRAIPVGRLGRPEDVGYACVYLASDEASWITGQTIALNGGSLTS
ncbi:MAG: SDR family oxidoreductase [Ilumatobacteraceae bacterium]